MCALEINPNHRIGGTVRLHRDHVPTSPKFVYVFCLLDRNKMELTRIWVVPSRIFYARAYRTALPKGMIQFNFDCQPGGADRWGEFEVTRSELGPRLVTLIRAAAQHGKHAKQQVPAGRWLELAA